MKTSLRPLLISLLLIPILSTGCNTVHSKETEDQRSLHLLNDGRYEEAAALLETMAQKQPDDATISLRLVSAYAGSAGINIVDAFPFFNHLIAMDDERSKIKNISGASSKKQDKAEKIVTFITQLANMGYIFFTIPYPSPELRPKLVHSLDLLTHAKDTDEDFAVKVKTYSLFLNSIHFGNTIRDMMPKADITSESDVGDLLCGIEADLFSANLVYALDQLKAVTDDLTWLSEHSGKRLGNARLSKLKDSADKLRDVLQASLEEKVPLEQTLRQLQDESCQ